MKFGAEIKQYFKKLGIPVRVRTVAVKRPFVQVWIDSVKLDGKQFFPQDLRRNLLTVIYGAEFVSKFSEYAAGNIQRHSLSFTETEWRAAHATKLCNICRYVRVPVGVHACSICE